MSWFRRPPEPDSVMLGREHKVPAEIHYSSGAGSWWYHGRLWIADTRPVREYEFNPVLSDPRNKPIIDALKKSGRTVEEAAKACNVPVWVARDVARALESAGAPHVLRVYGLMNARKAEERVLVTIDQDLIHEAPMKAYTQTEKGARNMQRAMIAMMVIVDLIFLVAMASLTSLGPAAQYNPGPVIASFTQQFGEAIAFPTAILAVYVVMARRTQVLDMELQPVLEGLQDTHSEAVYLVNSEKTPASTYVSRILRLDPGAIRELAEEITRFQSDTVSNLMDHQLSLRDQLDQAKILGIERMSHNADMQILGRATSGSGSSVNWTVVVAVIACVSVIAVVGTWLLTTGGA